jgi:hypothetical protein
MLWTPAFAGVTDLRLLRVRQFGIIGNDARFMQVVQHPGDAGQISRPVIHDADHVFPLFRPDRKTKDSSNFSFS